jgi:hypothetical protein
MVRLVYLCVVLALVVFCATALGEAEQRIAVAENKANPCEQLGNPPNVGQCWGCFQSLLADCDRQSNEANRRKACYEGANNFFTWCLGRVGNNVNPRQPQTRDARMERSSGFAYDIAFTAPVDPSLIEVYIRDMEDGKPRQQQVRSFVFANDDGSLSVFFDNNNLGLEDDKVVGVVTAVRNVNGGYDAAYADAYDIITAGDLDGDGVVDSFDLSKAWNLYASGEMSFESFMEFIAKFSNR